MTIYSNQSEQEYHAHDALSRSGAFTLAKRTPAHFKAMPQKKSKAMDLGKATHVAVLEPHKLDDLIMQGPIDRRGNKWTDLVAYCEAYGKIPLTSGDYSKAMYMRDSAQRLPEIRALTSGGGLIEHSGYWVDEETGVLCRCRPDIYHPELKIIGDVKTTTNASADAFGRSVDEFGYHVQEPWYSRGWEQAGGGEVDGFLFFAIENEHPFLCAVYELIPSAVVEGAAIARKGVLRYKQCSDTNDWPGYPEGVQQLDIPKYAYRETFKQQGVPA